MSEPIQREQLSAYLDGELTAEEARRVEQAVEADADLARELADLRAVRELLAKMPREHAGAGFAADVVRRAQQAGLVQGRAGSERRSRNWARRLAMAAVLVLAVGVGLAIIASLWAPRPRGAHVAMRKDQPEQPAEPPRPAELPSPPKGVPHVLREEQPPAKVAAREAQEGPEPPEAAGAPAPAPAPVDREAEELAAAPQVEQVINARDLRAAQRQFEQVLAENSIAVGTPEEVFRDLRSRTRRQMRQAYNAAPVRADQVRYVVLARPEQAWRLGQDLVALQQKGAWTLGSDGSAARAPARAGESTRRIAGATEGQRPETTDWSTGFAAPRSARAGRDEAAKPADQPPTALRTAGQAEAPSLGRPPRDRLGLAEEAGKFITVEITLNQAADAPTRPAPATQPESDEPPHPR